MNAAHVLGEPDFITVNVATNQSGFSLPGALAYDAVNTLLYVADINNNRVMVFNVAPGSIADDENASFVLGQAGFTTTIPATSQSGLSAPYGLAYDSANTRLFVGELGSLGSGITGNNRIVVYNTSSLTNGMNASNVLGQSNFTTANVCPDPTQSSFCNVFNFDYDGVHNRLFVADGGNSRVLAFNTSSITNGMNAANVLGPTTFTDGNGGSTWQSGLGDPSSAFYDSTNNQVYVGDAGNNRVMIYGTASITNGENASDEIGQYASLTSTATVNWSQPAPNNGLIAQGFNNPAGIALDRVNHRLFVVDNLNSRAFVYNLNTDNSFSTRVPANVLGEPDFFSTNYGNTDVDTLNDPNGAAFDAANNRLFVADTASNRVLVYNTSSITNGMNAANVLGQANFTNAGTAKTQARMNAPEGIAYDSTNNRLFVADQGNNRVLVYNTSSITNGMNAANVLGQADFTHNATAHTQAGMNNPSDVRYDPVNNRLFVADLGNNRVLVFNASSITNGMNAANVLGQTSFTANGSGTTQSTMNVPASVDYDPNTGRAFVVDNTNHRVLIFNAGPGNISNGMKASYVLGQADFTSAFYNYPPNQGSLTYPFFVTYDPGSGRLFVGDTNNNRVMIFEASTNSTPAQQGFIPGYE
jgi:DNA-binding beta-propeller fold protein YncE